MMKPIKAQSLRVGLLFIYLTLIACSGGGSGSSSVAAPPGGGGGGGSSSVTTIGSGHAQFPNPGFRTLSASVDLSSYSAMPNKLSHVSVGDMGAQKINSTGNTGYTMAVSFVSIQSEDPQ